MSLYSLRNVQLQLSELFPVFQKAAVEFSRTHVNQRNVGIVAGVIFLGIGAALTYVYYQRQKVWKQIPSPADAARILETYPSVTGDKVAVILKRGDETVQGVSVVEPDWTRAIDDMRCALELRSKDLADYTDAKTLLNYRVLRDRITVVVHSKLLTSTQNLVRTMISQLTDSEKDVARLVNAQGQLQAMDTFSFFKNADTVQRWWVNKAMERYCGVDFHSVVIDENNRKVSIPKKLGSEEFVEIDLSNYPEQLDQVKNLQSAYERIRAIGLDDPRALVEEDVNCLFGAPQLMKALRAHTGIVSRVTRTLSGTASAARNWMTSPATWRRVTYEGLNLGIGYLGAYLAGAGGVNPAHFDESVNALQLQEEMANA